MLSVVINPGVFRKLPSGLTIQGFALCFPAQLRLPLARCSWGSMEISSTSDLLQDGNYMVYVLSLIFFTGRRFCQAVVVAVSVGPDGVGAVQP